MSKEKKPHCALCESANVIEQGLWIICKKCGFRRKRRA